MCIYILCIEIIFLYINSRVNTKLNSNHYHLIIKPHSPDFALIKFRLRYASFAFISKH